MVLYPPSDCVTVSVSLMHCRIPSPGTARHQEREPCAHDALQQRARVTRQGTGRGQIVEPLRRLPQHPQRQAGPGLGDRGEYRV